MERWAQIHQNVCKIKKLNILWESVFKYKYKILCGKMYLNTNTVFFILKIHKIHLKLSMQVTLLRPVYTKKDNYNDNYISVF